MDWVWLINGLLDCCVGGSCVVLLGCYVFIWCGVDQVNFRIIIMALPAARAHATTPHFGLLVEAALHSGVSTSIPNAS